MCFDNTLKNIIDSDFLNASTNDIFMRVANGDQYWAFVFEFWGSGLKIV